MQKFLHRWRMLLKGRLSQPEASAFLEFLESSEGKKQFREEVANAYREYSEDEADWNSEKVLASILQKKEINPSWFGRAWVNFRWQAAAVVLIVGSIGLLAEHYLSIQQSALVVEEVLDQPQVTVKYNPRGKKSKIKLPDNSWVYLNSESYISYDEGFANGREVRLVGEAFFEVEKDSLRPFRVVTGRLATTALGTSFNVNAYSEAATVQVTLATGKVKVQDGLSEDELVLYPGEASEWKDKNKTFRKMQSDPNQATAWKDGVLHFEHTPLSEVVLLLERWYGVKINGPATWPEIKCSGTFKKNEYLSNVLKVLSHSVGFTYSIDGKNVTIIVKP